MAVGVLLAGILGVFYPEIFTTFKAITPYLLGFVMFGMGLGLSFHDFFNVVTNPKTVIFGILSYVGIPLSCRCPQSQYLSSEIHAPDS